MTRVNLFPDAELLLLGAIAPGFPSYRCCTSLPADIVGTTVRFKRVSGAAHGIRIDRPVVDVDVFAATDGDSSLAAREVQAALLSLRGAEQMNGAVVQSVSVVVGPRWLPDPNPGLSRFSATYQVNTHS